MAKSRSLTRKLEKSNILILVLALIGFLFILFYVLPFIAQSAINPQDLSPSVQIPQTTQPASGTVYLR